MATTSKLPPPAAETQKANRNILLTLAGRVREGGGEGAGRYGAATTAALATATEGDSAMGQIYGSVKAKRSFGAANAALYVFNSLSLGVNACVLSNGGFLERQQ